jgi:alpha-D-ribose 1-methylphosphonate 5-triphosphate synthase subunit PhnG
MEFTIEKEGDLPMRRAWMRTLAKAPVEMLEEAWNRLAQKPPYRFLRQPETGLVMVRGRADGVGRNFNLGEITLTRCTVKVNEGAAGSAYIMGRNKRHAELAAVFDGLLQDPELRPQLIESVIRPLDASRIEREERSARETAASRVEFFTMVRGE